MFNGIIKKVGKIKSINIRNNNCILIVKSQLKFSNQEIGSSVSCSGVCLTLEKIKGKLSTFYLSKETLNRSNFNTLKKDSIINIEKSLKFGDRVSGHFVQGHVDTTASIKKINFFGKSWYIHFKILKKFKKNLIQKGSVAINGVSLTISQINVDGFQVVVIPQTLKLTNLMLLREKDIVNVEFDILGKYIKNFLK